MTKRAGFTVSVITESSLTGDRLVAELERLGLRYLSRGPLPEANAPLAPEALISGLTASSEARLRAALIPLFLWRTEYATAALAVANWISGKPRVTLLCYYSAAIALQRRHATRLRELGRPDVSLPDLFAMALDLPPLDDPEPRLAAVAERHAQLSGEAINWLGTYEHAAATFLRFAEPLPA
jgi:hypothetical protein